MKSSRNIFVSAWPTHEWPTPHKPQEGTPVIVSTHARGKAAGPYVWAYRMACRRVGRQSLCAAEPVCGGARVCALTACTARSDGGDRKCVAHAASRSRAIRHLRRHEPVAAGSDARTAQRAQQAGCRPNHRLITASEELPSVSSGCVSPHIENLSLRSGFSCSFWPTYSGQVTEGVGGPMYLEGRPRLTCVPPAQPACSTHSTHRSSATGGVSGRVTGCVRASCVPCVRALFACAMASWTGGLAHRKARRACAAHL
eukprot:COSAG01_NODE_4979_length_4565_cov_5.005364_6_plen_256_part_00